MTSSVPNVEKCRTPLKLKTFLFQPLLYHNVTTVEHHEQYTGKYCTLKNLIHRLKGWDTIAARCNKNYFTTAWLSLFFSDRAIFVWPWKVVSVSVCYCFISQWMKRSKHGLFVFPRKKTLIWGRYCSTGQSCCSITWKRSIGWFLESSSGMKFFSRALA